jgi:hypothetical protein
VRRFTSSESLTQWFRPNIFLRVATHSNATTTHSKSSVDQTEKRMTRSRAKNQEDASVVSSDELTLSRAGSTVHSSETARRESLSGISRSYSNKEKLHCEYFDEEKHLDDGDLPTLSMPLRRTLSTVSATSSVASIRARRLSPTSKNKHRAFWNQLEVDQDSDDDEGKIHSGSRNRKKRISTVADEDGEDDGGFISAMHSGAVTSLHLRIIMR